VSRVRGSRGIVKSRTLGRISQNARAKKSFLAYKGEEQKGKGGGIPPAQRFGADKGKFPPRVDRSLSEREQYQGGAVGDQGAVVPGGFLCAKELKGPLPGRGGTKG
jgi:hypothetical protein